MPKVVGNLAINAGSVYSELILDASKYEAGLKKAERQMKGFSGMMKSAGKKMEHAGKTMTTKVTTPILAMGTAAVVSTAKFDDRMSAVQAVSGATGEQMVKLRDRAREMGRDTRYSASEAAEGMENLARAGFDVDEIYTAIPHMLNLASAGQLELADAASITANMINAFGLEASDAQRVTDVLAQAAANADTDVYGLGEAMSYLAPIAYDMGWSIEETSAAVMVFSDAGLKGSRAGSVFSTSLSRLANPTGEAAKLMNELNLEFFDADGAMKPLPDVVAELEKGLEGMTDQQRSAALATLFGSEAQKHWSILLREGSDGLRELTGELENSEGAAQSQSEIMEDNFAGALRSMKSAIGDVAIAIGDILTPKLQEIAEKIREVAVKFTELNPETQESIVKALLLAAAIGPVVLGLGKLFTIVGTVSGAIKKMTGVFKLLTLAKMKDKVETLYLTGLYAKDAVVKGVSTVATKGMTAATMVWNGVAKVGALVTKGLGAAIGFLTSPIGIAVIAIAGAVAAGIALYKNWDKVKEKAGELGKAISEKWEGIKAKTKEAWENVKKSINERWEGIKSKTKESTENVKSKVNDSWNNLKSRTSEAWGNMKATVERNGGGIKGAARTMSNVSKSVWSSATSAMDRVTGGKFSSMASKVSGSFSNIKSYIQGGIDKIGSWNSKSVKEKFSSIATKVSDSFSKIKSSIQSGIDKITDWNNKKVKNKVATFTQKIKTVGSKLIGKNARGTRYWRGGLTWVGEEGPEIIDLPRGSKVYSNQKSRQLIGENTGGEGIYINIENMSTQNGTEDIYKVSHKLYSMIETSRRAKGDRG